MIKRLRENKVYENQRIQFYDDEVELPDKKKGNYIRLTYHGNPRGAVIIPRLPDGRLLLLKIFRYAVNEESLEFPRGGGHAHEDTEQVALRELRSETNLVPLRSTPLGFIRPDTAILMTEVGVVLMDLPNNAELGIVLSRKEGITEAEFLPLNEIMKLASQGKIRDGFTLGAIALLLAAEMTKLG